MAEIFRVLGRRLRRAFEYAWGYMGTLAALGLLLGVLGMGIFHSYTRDAPAKEVRCFTGLFNTAAPEAPRGIGQLPYQGADIPGPHIRFEYGEGGRMERLVHVDARGNIAPMPGSRVAEQKVEYDAAGRVVARRNYDAMGIPAADASGVSVREFEYDDAGQLVRNTLLNEQGRKIVPRMPGYAEMRLSWDAAGRPLSIRYMDGEGRPVTNARGENHIQYSYDDERHEVIRSNFIGDVLADNALGYATECRRSTADGSATHTSWKNAAGAPVRHPSLGAASLLAEQTRTDHLKRERLCSEKGIMRDSARVCAEHLVRTDGQGLVEWECFNAADGLPCQNEALGYAERVCEYAPDGTLQREYFWDAGGNPSSCYEKRYAVSNGTRHVLSLHADGSTELRQE